MSDIRVIVGLDFGTTYSGFACCHIEDTKKLFVNDQWPGESGSLKTNTVLQYDSDFINVEKWGIPALSKRPSKRNRNEERPVELFKLYLGNLQQNLRPKLPIGFKKAITDYLFEFGKLIKKTVIERWPGIDFTENVRLILTVPAEYSEKDKAIMRECVYKAKLIESERSKNLQFTTEPEAAALYCTESKLQEYDLLNIGTTFMIVDCGGGTVDLTTRKLIGNKRLGEITERIGDFCGSTFIDKEFVKFLRGKLGINNSAMDLLERNHYGQFQYLIQHFCRRAKTIFSGDTGFLYQLDIEENAPILMQYVSEEIREIMEEKEWLINIKYNDIKKMFDPIVDRIIRLIHLQLTYNRETCSAMFLVGGFSQSKYLQKRIKQEFHHIVEIISVPNQPVAAIVRGAVTYGLSLQNSPDSIDKMDTTPFAVYTRTLKFTYGIKVLDNWNDSHSSDRIIHNDRIYRFDTLVKRGREVKVDEEFSKKGYTPLKSSQTGLKFELYKTPKYEARYHDEPEMKLVGTLRIDLPDDLACNRPVTFGFSFGQMEITAFARSEFNGQNFHIKFDLSQDDEDEWE